jgi:hypothetical protein
MKHVHFVRHTASVVVAICSSLLGFALFAPSAFGLMVGFQSYANGRVPVFGGNVSGRAPTRPDSRPHGCRRRHGRLAHYADRHWSRAVHRRGRGSRGPRPSWTPKAEGLGSVGQVAASQPAQQR